MANTYTTDDLVDNILLISHMPLGNQTFTTPEVLTLANRELQTPIMKQILSTRGGYYMTYTDYEAAQDGLYDIPSACVAGALLNVELVQNTSIIPVNIIEESEQFSTISPTSTTYGFFMRGNQVQILPTPSIGYARLWYSRRPSVLVSTTVCAQVTAINGAVLSVSSVPSNLVVGSLVDVCGDQPPFNILGSSDITDITGTDVTLSDPITDVAVGDWICLENQTCVPQIPVEFRPLLEQRTVVKMYELQGYLDKMQVAKASLQELEAATFNLITPRVKSQTKVIVAINGGVLAGNPNKMTNFPAARN